MQKNLHAPGRSRLVFWLALLWPAVGSAATNPYHLHINELLAVNDHTCHDEAGEYDDWVEIYNSGSQPVDLAGFYLTDDLDAVPEWRVPYGQPENTVVQPGGYLLFWFDRDPEQGPRHVDARLSGDGEQVGLFAPDGVTLVDGVTFGRQSADVSLGRSPDASARWLFFLSPTPAADNGPSPFATSLPEYHISCDPDSFAWIYAHPHEDHYISAPLTLAGYTWPDTRLRIRGDSSRNYPKKSLKLKFPEQEFVNGRDRLNFNASYFDRTYTHIALSSFLFQAAEQPCFAVDYAALYLNDEFLGLYVLVENMDGAFLESRGLSPAGNLYKASRDGACLSIYDDVDYHWEKKTNSQQPRDDLVQLIAAVNETPATEFAGLLAQTFGTEPLVNIIALNMLLANGSTYYHNYYLYHDTPGTGRWHMLPWDLDRTISSYGVNYPFHRSSQDWYPDNPLLERTLITPVLYGEVRDRVAELTQDLFQLQFLDPVLDSLAAQLYPWIPLDTTDNLSGISQWEELLQNERAFLQLRPGVLQDQFDHWPVNFAVERSESLLTVGDTLIWHPSRDPDGGQLQYRVFFTPDPRHPEEAVVMAAGSDTFLVLGDDGPPPGDYFWKVHAVDGGVEIPGFDHYNPCSVVLPPRNDSLVINEINYHGSPAADPGDWVEVFNASPQTVDLEGAFMLTDNDGLPLPGALSLEPGAFLVLCSREDLFAACFPDIPAVELPALELADTGSLTLTAAGGDLLDQVAYDHLPPWPVSPNGGGTTLSLLSPDLDNSRPTAWAASLRKLGTPGTGNGLLLADCGSLVAFPNPGSTICFQFTSAQERSGELRIYNMLGEEVRCLPYTTADPGRQVIFWEPATVANGIYLVRRREAGTWCGALKVTVLK